MYKVNTFLFNLGMRINVGSIPSRGTELIDSLRLRLRQTQFAARHRFRPQDFTRHRQLTFPFVMLFILQKTAKSVQRHLHELLRELAEGSSSEPVTPGAWTHARAKLKHTAFIELNDECVLPAIYGEQNEGLRRWRGHRLLGLDSSVLRLPNNDELREAFTAVDVQCQFGDTGVRLAQARICVLYDLLNRAALDARLEPSTHGEVELAIEQLPRAQAGDVTISDRGYAGYRYFAVHQKLGLHFIVRCSSGSFAAAQELFRLDRAGRSRVVRLLAPLASRAQIEQEGLALELPVRFVSLRLPNGKLEVLATSLLAEDLYPTGEFLEIYDCRWNHETFHLMLKSRLDLENFSGETAEAVRQDFHSTVLLCNLESILTQPAGQALEEHSVGQKHPKQVNRSVSYHALKVRLFDLLYSSAPAEEVIRELQILFAASSVSVRKREAPRKKPSENRSYHYQKRVKKMVF